MSVKKRGLGRGLDALLSSVSGEAPQPNDASESLRELSLDSLSPGRFQPRRHFEPEALATLAESIKAQGVVQPIVARELDGDRFEIVAGERRWRAARLAGLTTIPAIVRVMHDQAAMAVALVENIQRADLNPLEEAEALRRLIDECGLTHEQAAEAVGRSRAAVSNLLRLMDLHADVQALVREGRLSLGHAKVLMAAPVERQPMMARQVVDGELTVRETEALIAATPKPPVPMAAGQPPAASTLETELSERLALPVSLKQSKSGKGELTIRFENQAGLDRLLGRLR
jgi:ParB family chromosome partitioning protein